MGEKKVKGSGVADVLPNDMAGAAGADRVAKTADQTQSLRFNMPSWLRDYLIGDFFDECDDDGDDGHADDARAADGHGVDDARAAGGYDAGEFNIDEFFVDDCDAEDFDVDDYDFHQAEQRTWRDRLETLGYLLWAISFAPVCVASAAFVWTFAVGIQSLLSVDLFVATALAIVPIGVVAKAFFEWMDHLGTKPAAPFVHVIASTLVFTEMFMLVLFCWVEDLSGISTTFGMIALIVYLVVLVLLLTGSLANFVILARRKFRLKLVRRISLAPIIRYQDKLNGWR